MSYAEFLATKAVQAKERGLKQVPMLAPHLFPFQRHCVEFALRVGSSGCFLSTGLGKTEVQLEWCQRAMEAVGGKALILTPLAVASQTSRRAAKWGYEARVIREQEQAASGINICNYDRLDKLDPTEFSVVALDEASILKSFTGKTTRKLIEAFRGHRFKLTATATPAPNDHMEIGQYCEFLSVMPSNEMLMRWFIADQTEMGRYRLKGHASQSFYEWFSSWARMAELPSDLGDSDEGFILPPLDVRRHRAADVNLDKSLADMFGAPVMSATTMHEVKRQTSQTRADAVATIIAEEPDEPWLVWCDTDYEADALRRVLPDAIEVRGSQPIDEKESKLEAFATGRAKRLIGKPSMLGFGLDWSHCARMVFVSRSYSYETYFQAVRRCWRFGQRRRVAVHLVIASGEDTVGHVIDRKADDHRDMIAAMRKAMLRGAATGATRKVAYSPNHQARLPSWI